MRVAPAFARADLDFERNRKRERRLGRAHHHGPDDLARRSRLVLRRLGQVAFDRADGFHAAAGQGQLGLADAADHLRVQDQGQLPGRQQDLPPVRRVGRVLVVVIFLFGLSTIGFGLAMWFPLSLFFYAMTGVTDQISVVVRQSIVQLGTPDALRGRVSSVNQVFTGASDQLGAVESGLVASWTNAVVSVVTGGIGTLISLGIVVKLVPALWTHRVDSAEERARER